MLNYISIIINSDNMSEYSRRLAEDYMDPDPNDPDDVTRNMNEREKEIYREAFAMGYYMGCSETVEQVLKREVF